MYVSIMERKGIEKGIQLGEARGIQLGRNEGIQLGEIRGRTETARNLLRMGLDSAKIAEATGLPMEEIQALKKQDKFNRFPLSTTIDRNKVCRMDDSNTAALFIFSPQTRQHSAPLRPVGKLHTRYLKRRVRDIPLGDRLQRLINVDEGPRQGRKCHRQAPVSSIASPIAPEGWAFHRN